MGGGTLSPKPGCGFGDAFGHCGQPWSPHWCRMKGVRGATGKAGVMEAMGELPYEEKMKKLGHLAGRGEGLRGVKS